VAICSSSVGEKPVDAGERGLGATGSVTVSSAPQGWLAQPQARPSSVSIDKHPSFGHHVRQEGWVVLRIAKANNLNRTADRRSQPLAQVNHLFQTRVAQINDYVDIAGGRVGPSRRRAEQHGEANVLLRPQCSPKSRHQMPRAPHVLPLRERQVELSRSWTTSPEAALVHGSSQSPLINAHMLGQET
jgi:hypothetical protein